MPWFTETDQEAPNFMPVASDILEASPSPPPEAMATSAGAGPTVVALESGPEEGDPFASDKDNEPAGAAVTGPKARGRPSRSASGTPVVSAKKATRTPKSAKATKAVATTSGRKRKAPTPEVEAEDDNESEEAEEDANPTPAKRGRPARAATTVASARLAAKAANKPKRGRPKGTGAATEAVAAKKPASRGRKANGTTETPAEEYEVEKIVDSMIDADTMEHMYRIKWKGYGEEENTWEPKTNLGHALELVKAFDAKKRAAGKSAAAPATSAEPKKRGRPAKRG